MNIPLPPSITTSDGADGYTITRVWRNWTGLLYMVSALFPGVFFFFAFQDLKLADDIAAPFMVALVVITVIPLYQGAATWLNRTVITLSSGILKVAHGPLPWPGNRTATASDVSQLSTHAVVTRSKSGTTTTYSVRMSLNSGKRIDLLKGLAEPEHGKAVENLIEQRLGLANRPVEGEV